MRLLDVRAHPDLAKRLSVESPPHPRWPVILSLSRGVETRRSAGHIRDSEVADWVHEEAWLLNE
jgi:hypothetical protein